jgi:aspartyl-tRNA(Asn)/glutamyl-tRNA(Gln) amidotransferase subunit A
MTIAEAARRLRARELSSVELTQDCLSRIDRLNPRLNAFVTVTHPLALEQARAADAAFARGTDLGPLQGIPVAAKDIFDTAGVRTTYGSRIFAEHVPAADAALIRALRDAGAVLVGKTGLHEFAYGITSTNPHFGAIRNPWNPERIPGGSSGGSAVAVATGMALMALGTDTGGSIRIPSSFCGVCGIKPSFGLLSTQGCRALAASLDHMGPMAASVEDLALSLSVLSGHPPAPKRRSLAGLRWGIAENYFFDHALPEVREGVWRMAQAAAGLGAAVETVRVAAAEELTEAAFRIILAEAADSVADVWDRRAEFGEDVRQRFEQGRAQDPLLYLRAQQERVAASREFLRVFARCDILLAPATPTAAPRIGQTTLTEGGKEVDLRVATTRPSRPINLLGIPALALPCGTSPDGLPLGAQLLAPWGQERRLLAAGALLESVLGPWARPIDAGVAN